MQTIRGYLGGDVFEDGVGCTGGRDVDDGAVGLCFLDRLADRGEDGEAVIAVAEAVSAAEAGVHAGDDPGAVVE